MPYHPNASTTGPLAVASHHPASITFWSTTSTVPVAVDAGPLSISFTVPASGKVLFVVSAVADRPAAGQATIVGALDGSTVVLDDLAMHRNASAHRCTPHGLATGLTPGGPVTWDLAFRRGTSTGFAILRAGQTTGESHGPIVLSVWEVPA